MNSKLNRAIVIIAKIVEVFMWVGCAGSAILTGLTAAGRFDLMRFFTDARPDAATLSGSGFSLAVQNAQGEPSRAAFALFFLTLLFTFALMGMCARNVYLIFKTAEGRTRFSRGETPFQPDIVRMVREIGIFLIAIPAVHLIMSIVARIALGRGAVESSVNMVGVFMGLVVLALSRYFAYGMKLQNEVDGLV